MCGIAGILNFDGRTVAPAAIEAMTTAIAHRGRDSAGIVVGGRDGGLDAHARPRRPDLGGNTGKVCLGRGALVEAAA